MNLCFLSIWGIVFAVLGAIFLRADQAELAKCVTFFSVMSCSWTFGGDNDASMMQVSCVQRT